MLRSRTKTVTGTIPTIDGGAVKCKCNLPAVLRTSSTTTNPGRGFYACARGRKGDEGSCGFFQWADESQSKKRQAPANPPTPTSPTKRMRFSSPLPQSSPLATGTHHPVLSSNSAFPSNTQSKITAFATPTNSLSNLKSTVLGSSAHAEEQIELLRTLPPEFLASDIEIDDAEDEVEEFEPTPPPKNFRFSSPANNNTSLLSTPKKTSFHTPEASVTTPTAKSHWQNNLMEDSDDCSPAPARSSPASGLRSPVSIASPSRRTTSHGRSLSLSASNHSLSSNSSSTSHGMTASPMTPSAGLNNRDISSALDQLAAALPALQAAPAQIARLERKLHAAERSRDMRDRRIAELEGLFEAEKARGNELEILVRELMEKNAALERATRGRGSMSRY